MHLRAREKLTRMAQKDSHGRVIFRWEKQDPFFGDLDFEDPQKGDLDVKFFLGTFRGQLDMHLRAREKLSKMGQKDSHGRVIFRREKQNRIFHDLDFENREKYDLDFENREKYDLDFENREKYDLM